MPLTVGFPDGLTNPIHQRLDSVPGQLFVRCPVWENKVDKICIVSRVIGRRDDGDTPGLGKPLFRKPVRLDPGFEVCGVHRRTIHSCGSLVCHGCLVNSGKRRPLRVALRYRLCAQPGDAGIDPCRPLFAAFKKKLPEALRHLQKGNIAPVDLAQAAIGPGMAVFSRYAKVLKTDSSTMPVRSALTENKKCLDEVQAEQEGESGAAELIHQLGAKAEVARDLSYRLYTICERRKWAQEAIAYNALVLSWSDVQRLAQEKKAVAPTQGELI